MGLQYPLNLSFKLISWGPQIFIRDASGREVFFVHQKALKLKEDINVYSDSRKSQVLFNIKADRWLDFNATYSMTSGMGKVGAVKREGMRSLWSATYNIMDNNGSPAVRIKEDNAWVKVMDYLIGEIPIVGMFSGYLFHPSYTVYRTGTDAPLLRLTKQPAFFEGKFDITKLSDFMGEEEEVRVLLSLLMLVLLERQRG
jgi:uncharacterized protein YxjI